jgi:hypothetical protein
MRRGATAAVCRRCVVNVVIFLPIPPLARLSALLFRDFRWIDSAGVMQEAVREPRRDCPELLRLHN